MQTPPELTGLYLSQAGGSGKDNETRAHLARFPYRVEGEASRNVVPGRSFCPLRGSLVRGSRSLVVVGDPQRGGYIK